MAVIRVRVADATDDGEPPGVVHRDERPAGSRPTCVAVRKSFRICRSLGGLIEQEGGHFRFAEPAVAAGCPD